MKDGGSIIWSIFLQGLVFDKSELSVSLYQKMAKIIEKTVDNLPSFYPAFLKKILEEYNRIYLILDGQNKAQTVFILKKLRAKSHGIFLPILLKTISTRVRPKDFQRRSTRWEVSTGS